MEWEAPARIATLKQNLASAGRTPFLVQAGDVLSPSVASATFKGEQMVAALNAAGLDLATLGKRKRRNHREHANHRGCRFLRSKTSWRPYLKCAVRDR
jgi:hypothetical protein